MRNAACLFASVLFLVLPVLPAAADCTALVGQRIVLASDDYDPDVLLWDSQQRLMDYAAGNWEVAKVLLPHALLARPGTRGFLVSCKVNVVHPKYRLAPMDAAGVKITSGPYKGRYVWVLAEDLHTHLNTARRK